MAFERIERDGKVPSNEDGQRLARSGVAHATETRPRGPFEVLATIIPSSIIGPPRPCVHEPAAPVEPIAAPVGRLYLVADCVS